MRGEKILKLLGLNIGVAIVNVVVFSPGLLGFSLGEASVLQTAIALTVMVMSGIIFCFGNYLLIFKKVEIIRTDTLETVVDYINALEQNQHKKIFIKDIILVLEQIQRLEKKIAMVNELLLQKFDPMEMSYIKFEEVLTNFKNVFYLNIKSMINKMSIFDQKEYDYIHKSLGNKTISKEFIQTKLNIYNEYIAFIKEAIKDNEAILLKLDQLLLELSKLNSLEDGELESMRAMSELEELIHKIKFYK
ncbi:MAG: hypothetical protein ACRCTE_09590 [Cellulosilyticaceae bacterium]